MWKTTKLLIFIIYLTDVLDFEMMGILDINFPINFSLWCLIWAFILWEDYM